MPAFGRPGRILAGRCRGVARVAVQALFQIGDSHRQLGQLSLLCGELRGQRHQHSDDRLASMPVDSVGRRLRRVGEQWTFGLDPEKLPDYLAQRGFRLLKDIDSLAYRRRYLGSSPRLLRGYEFYHVALGQADES
jgi:hypothetical protein